MSVLSALNVLAIEVTHLISALLVFPVKRGAHKMSLSFYTELCNIVFIPRRCDLILYHYHSTAGTCGCGTVGGSTGASCGEFFLVSQLAWYITSSISLTLNHGHPSTQFCCSKKNKNTSSRFQSNPGAKMIDWIKEWRSEAHCRFCGFIIFSRRPANQWAKTPQHWPFGATRRLPHAMDSVKRCK